MTLHVLNQILKHPEMFESLFLDKVGNVTSNFVKCLLHLPDGANSFPSKKPLQMLLSFFSIVRKLIWLIFSSLSLAVRVCD